jgi:hypothetical protein
MEMEAVVQSKPGFDALQTVLKSRHVPFHGQYIVLHLGHLALECVHLSA